MITMKQIFIDALMGHGLRGTEYATRMEAEGAAEFCGNQHNPNWRWKRSVLEEMSESQLLGLYQSVCS
jgi:hypothetical protein